MQIFTAVDIALMGDMDPEYGQTYWGAVEEQSNPVRFNLKQVMDIAPGRQFVAEEIEHRTSKGKGKPYTQLKKVKLSEPTSVDQPAPQPTSESEWFERQEVPSLDNGPESPFKAPDKAAPSLGEAWRETTGKPDSVAQSLPKSRPEYETGTNARWAIGMAYRAYIQVMGTPEDGGGDFPFDVVKLHAQELLDMFDILTDKEE